MALNTQFELLDKTLHDLKGFDCGKPTMNDFLKQYAVKNNKLGLSRTWALTDTQDTGKAIIASYFTLAVQSVESKHFSTEQKLPRYPTPVTLLARIAVSQQYQHQGLGTKTLLAALSQAVKTCDNGLPTFAVVLDVLDDEAELFYQSFNFFKRLGHDRQLYVPMAALRELMQ